MVNQFIDFPWSWHYVSGVMRDSDGVEYAIHASTFEVGGHATTHASVRTRDGVMVSGETMTHGVTQQGVDFRSDAFDLVLALHAPDLVTLKPPERASSRTHVCSPSTLGFGYVRKDGKVVEVEGNVWYDHEELSSGHSPAWDWCSLRLDNGLRLYVYAVDGEKPYAVSIDDVTRQTRTYENISVKTHESYLSRTGRVYATKITIDVAGFGQFGLVPWMDEQEIDNSITPYYEGVCDVYDESHKIGTAFVEYVGRGVSSETNLLLRWCCGDADAAVCLRELAHGSQLADDFVDNDKDAQRGLYGDRSKAMLDLLTFAIARLPNNKFWQKYRGTLEPLVISSMFYWDLSNHLVTLKNENSRYYAYAYREMLEQVAGVTAYILGGLDHARRTLREIHQFYHVTNVDPFDHWWAEVSS